MDQELTARLQSLLNQAPIMLFMKGDKFLPQCGFSSRMVELLNERNAAYTTFDILEDEDVRQGLKEYSKWPTFPQLYVNGKLIGGLDIVQEMIDSNEFDALLKESCVKNG